ncbi:Uncharacterized protein HZ326_8833 [Fusarium oxysporum f. sp. albedinis]|nr:Uncharacterized protein HZ326_8833 [Fusarium oxysporum f. sp. albedinis]
MRWLWKSLGGCQSHQDVIKSTGVKHQHPGQVSAGICAALAHKHGVRCGQGRYNSRSLQSPCGLGLLFWKNEEAIACVKAIQ